MSSNHPISDSGSDWDDFLPAGLQSDVSSASSESEPEPAPKSNRTSSLDDNEDSRSRHSSKTHSLQGDEYAFDDTKAESTEDPTLTRSFLSVPEGLEPGKGGGDGAGVSKSTKTATKRKRRKSGAGGSPRRRRKKKVKDAHEEGDDEGDEEEEEEGDGSGKKKSKGKSKSKNKPPNRRRNIKSFLREDQLDAETLEAQLEEEKRKQRLEEERKRRLDEQKIQKMESSSAIVEKLQEAVATIAAAIPVLTASVSSAPEPAIPIPMTIPVPVLIPSLAECIVVDSGSDSDKDALMKAHKQEREVITISSDEEVCLVSDNSEDEAEMNMVSIGLHTNDEANVPDIHGRVLVNVNHPPDDPDIYLPDHIARAVKPHQIGGIRFLYDNLVESLQRYKASSGFGCILAHSMGLGKTLQCIAFIYNFMKYTMAHTVLCIVPINTLQNWLAEFDMWCPERPRHFNIFVLNDMHKTQTSRAKVIAEWRQSGGVLLMGYEMYRLLARSKQASLGRPKKRTSKSGKSSPQIIDIDEMEAAAEMAIDMKAALCNPGPDMVVCDEGHRIKNSHAGISQALKGIRTRRRVVLTGYPLQNNLQEYWCMVDFVRPNFLGTRHEFANLFERPISNGQCMDSTPYDVRLMRYRAHVLHSLLSGFVQRRGFNVLLSTLPPKEEHVIMVRLTSFQRGLYIRFMQCFTEAGAGGWCSSNPLKAFSVGCKIWNHPDILSDQLSIRDSVKDNVRDSAADELDADLDLPEVQAKCTGRQQKLLKKPAEERSSRRGEGSSSGGYIDKVQQIISFEWARDIMKNYTRNKLCNGGKIIVLFHILEESIRLGDKILVFSQSLSCLSVIEKFLAKSTIPQPPNPPPLMPREWVRNQTYFRLDGSTAVSEREKMINRFNSPDNKTIMLFLLSTKAGCLGINLIGANRVVVMDASWNPCHDAQAVCRVYRYGQTKKCHVYRLVSDQTLEKKIYDRQISKKGMSDRVVDEMNPEMNLTKKEVESLLEFDETDMPFEDFSHLAPDIDDQVLKSLLLKHSNCMTKAPFTTESLLWDRKDMKLTRAEKMQAKKSYEEEKKLNLSYSRPSYAAFYPKGSGPGGMSVPPAAKGVPNMNFNTGPAYPYLPTSLKQPLQRPVANVRPIQSTPVPRQPPTPHEVTQKRIRDLKNAGVTLQRIVATTNIMLPGANTSTESTSMIRAGDAVTFIKTKKGIYLRTHEGKILAVRGPNAGPGSLGAVAQGAFPDATPSDMGMVQGGGGGGDAGAGALVDGEGSGNYGTLPNLANTQLGQLLSQSVPPRQQSNSFSNPPLSLPSEIKPNLTMAGMPTTSGMFPPFAMSQSSDRVPSDLGLPSSSSMSNMGFGPSRSLGSFPPYPVPYSSSSSSYTPSYTLGNTSTLTMATDTVMHSSVAGTSSTGALSAGMSSSTLSSLGASPSLSSLGASPSFPSLGMNSTSLPETQSSFPDLYQDSSPSPSLSYPSFGDEYSNTSQGPLDTNPTSLSSNLETTSMSGNQGPQGLGSMSRVDEPISTPSPVDKSSLLALAPSPSNPVPFQQAASNSIPAEGNQVNPLSDLMSPSPAMSGGTQSVNLPSSLPFPQMEMNYPYPSLSRTSSGPSNGSMDSTSSLMDDGSDISNLSKFVDSSFPNLMPFSGSLNPDSDASSRSNMS
ncbi:helicase ARIP4-like [Strongylocentrotus purpuratus]|uniref:Helicase ARIP4-like n=1 Tax=Strongylocentrotus purpuratus TaxID=7668 RepID=A0A7M7SSD7_STRPU|nr:helicase ARIP4-like [Strongylocentrotus purpuratus]